MAKRLSSESKEEMWKTPRAQILVVDDDAVSRKILAQLLASAGLQCHECEDGTEALELIRAKQPSLLLLDFDMPGLNGAEVLKSLRSDKDPAIAQIPAIMLTGHGSEESEVRCLQAGADDFVTKPVNAAVLRARIETQLRLRSMRRQLERQNNELEEWRRNLERDLAAAQLTQQSLIPQKAAAALLTTLAKLLFHHGSGEHDSPARVMEAVNNDFRSIFGGRSFMTAMCVAVDPATGRATIVGAGHPPVLIARRGGGTGSIASVAPPLGLIEHPEFTETIVDLDLGDAFLLYTDGLFGAARGERLRLTPERLEKMLDHSAPNAEALLRGILNQVVPENGKDALPDDLAALAVRRMA